MRKLLLVDDSSTFTKTVSQQLQGSFHTYICTDGRQAMELLRSQSFDVLLVNLSIPGLDGIGILRRAAREGIRVPFITVADYYGSYALEQLERLRVALLLRSPCDGESAAEHVQSLAQWAESAHRGSKAEDALLELGFTPSRKGFSCTAKAVELLMQDMDRSFSKEVYPEVAAAVDGSAKQVEHAIRILIRSTWKKRRNAYWLRLFPDCGGEAGSCPTNRAFICGLASALQRN